MSIRNTRPTIARPALVATLALTGVLAACAGNNSGGQRADVEIRGSDPATTTQRPSTTQQQPQAPAKPDAQGIITYDGYQSALAKDGDTVADVAARVGMSASELGAYNGLQPNHQMRAGDELVLPQRPGGYGAGATVQTAQAAPAPAASTIEAQPLQGVGVSPDGSPGTPNAQPVPKAAPERATLDPDPADATQAGAVQPAQTQSDGWSPDIAAAAIDRSTGLQQDGTLGAPPSANDPTPPEPTARRNLDSPDLSQYQTPGEDGTEPAQPQTPAPATPTQDDQTVAAADTAPAPAVNASGLKLRRPVQGPVALGFNKGAGPQRNDGVDFAAPAGAPVVAAADGEVALVSQSLGGLGTIVLVRHPDEILTVYGRVDGVNVQKGDIVKRGQKIGVVSNAAAPAEPRMHFEVRRGAESLDPMQFL